jgi:lipopolysaccharide export LptBFGC system permease protein LptF
MDTGRIALLAVVGITVMAASFFFSLWIFSQTSAEFTEYFNGEIDKWAVIIKAANVKPEQ